jgi:hypothetical protein
MPMMDLLITIMHMETIMAMVTMEITELLQNLLPVVLSVKELMVSTKLWRCCWSFSRI